MPSLVFNCDLKLLKPYVLFFCRLYGMLQWTLIKVTFIHNCVPFTICLKVLQSTKKAKWLTYNQYNRHSLQVLGWDDCSLKSFVPKTPALLGILSPCNLPNGYEEYHIWLYISVVKTIPLTILSYNVSFSVWSLCRNNCKKWYRTDGSLRITLTFVTAVTFGLLHKSFLKISRLIREGFG